MSEGFMRKDIFLLSEFKSLSQDKLDPWVVRELDGSVCQSLRKCQRDMPGGWRCRRQSSHSTQASSALSRVYKPPVEEEVNKQVITC